MSTRSQNLADLHLHLYGSIHWRQFLEFVRSRSVDWTSYENSFLDAYGERPPIREVLARCNPGNPAAEREFRRLFVFQDEDAGNFARFQAKYNMLVDGSRWATYQKGSSSHSALVTEVCSFMRQILARQRTENIAYAEQRMTLHSRFTPAQAGELLRGMLATYSEYEGSDIQPRLAISLSRDDPWPHWEATKDAALGPNGHILTGIDFCYLEEGYPPKKQREFFEAVMDFNQKHPERAFAILYHVGESFDDKSLESAVRWVHEAAELGVHRLGHAIALGVSPDRYGVHSRQESVEERIDQLNYDLRHRDGLMSFGVRVDVQAISKELEQLSSMAQKNLVTIEYSEQRLEEVRHRQRYAANCIKALGSVIEVCPTSNRRIGGISDAKHHPIRQFIDFGVPFVVGSDDPGIFDTTLDREIESAIAIAELPEDFYGDIVERAWRCRSEVLTGRVR